MTLELQAKPEEVMRAVEALQEFGEAAEIPPKILFGLTLALEECGSNIVNHGLLRNPDAIFHVSFDLNATGITIELRDPGPEFDPTLKPADEPEADDDAPPGGWGIFLVRRYTDEMCYFRKNGENVLRLTKVLNPPPLASNPCNSNNTMPLEIHTLQNIGSQNTGTITIKLIGSLDTATAPDLEREIGPVLARCGKDLVFDLAQLKFISSAGLRVFSIVRKQLKERGGQATFINMQPQITEVFEIIKALPGVAVFASEAEFDAYLTARQKACE